MIRRRPLLVGFPAALVAIIAVLSAWRVRSDSEGTMQKTTSELTSAERGARVRFPPPLVFLICTLFGVLFRYAVTAAPLPVDRPISAIGGVLILVIGGGLIASARMGHKRTGQNPAPWKPSPELILKGPYRFTRNPMYLGVTAVQFGLGVALNNLWISLFAFPALLAVHFIAVVPEERYLSAKFGDDYAKYRARVRRYL